MAGEEDGGSARRFPTEDLRERLHRHRVETGEGLVEDEELGLVEERSRELRALLVAVRKRLDLLGRAVGEVEPLEPRHGCGARGTRFDPVQAGEVGELLADGHTRIEAALLGHVAEALALPESDRPHVPKHLSSSSSTRPKTARMAVVLPAPFGPKTEHAPTLDGERAAGERLHLPEPLRDVDDAEHRLPGVAATRAGSTHAATSPGQSSGRTRMSSSWRVRIAAYRNYGSRAPVTRQSAHDWCGLLRSRAVVSLH